MRNGSSVPHEAFHVSGGREVEEEADGKRGLEINRDRLGVIGGQHIERPQNISRTRCRIIRNAIVPAVAVASL